MSPRRRALLLGGLALTLGALAASDVAGREARVERSLGPLVPVLVADRPLRAGARIAARDLAVRRVPARFAPAGALSGPGEALGLKIAAAVPAGADLTLGVLADVNGGGRAAGAPVHAGERIAEVIAAGPAGLIEAGSRIDLLVTTEARAAQPARSFVALQDVEVVGTVVANGGTAGEGSHMRAALRVTLRQAVFLAAAQSFARELRLLPRAAGDHGRLRGPLSVGAALR